MSRFSILTLAVAFCLYTHEANAQNKTTAQHKILQEKTWAWKPSNFNYAKLNDLVFEVGMGNHPNGGGAAYAGIEIENASTVKVTTDTPFPFIYMDDNSLAGFMVDYHTAGGYTKRVALAMGLFSKKRGVPGPIEWGKAKPPDQFVDLGKKKEYDLDLKAWAPEGWDGKVWFSVSLQNSGRNTILKAKVQLLNDKIDVAQKPNEKPGKKEADRQEQEKIAAAERAQKETAEKAERERREAIGNGQKQKNEPGKKEEKTIGKKEANGESKEQVVTADYLPHHPGTSFYANNLQTIPAIASPFGLTKATQTKDGATEWMIVMRGTLENKTDVNEPLAPVYHREHLGFLEVGRKIKKKGDNEWTFFWTPALKLGAKEGDTWKWKDSVFTLSFATTYNGLPSAVVERILPLPNGDSHISRTHYVKVIGQVESAEHILTKTGKTKPSYTWNRVVDSDYVLKAIRNGYYTINLTPKGHERDFRRPFDELRLGLPFSLSDSDVPGLIKVVGSQENKSLRSFAIAALGNIGADSPAALSALKKVVEEDNLAELVDGERLKGEIKELDNDIGKARKENTADSVKTIKSLNSARLAKAQELSDLKQYGGYAKRSMARISEVIAFRKYIAGEGGTPDPIVRMLLKPTSEHYKEVGFKKYTFGMTTKEVNDLTHIGIPVSTPWSISSLSRWLGNSQGEHVFFIDGKLAGFNKMYRKDVEGLLPTVKDKFGTTHADNIISYSTLDNLGPTFRTDFTDTYYFYPKTIAGMTWASENKQKDTSHFLDLSVVDRQWFEFVFDQSMKTTRKRVAAIKEITSQVAKLRGLPTLAGVQEKINGLPKVAGVKGQVFGKGTPTIPQGTVLLSCDHTRFWDSPGTFTSLFRRGESLLLQEYFPSASGKITVTLTTREGAVGVRYQWQTEEGWEVELSGSTSTVIMKPKRELD